VGNSRLSVSELIRRGIGGKEEWAGNGREWTVRNGSDEG